jgi:hypothetical protein
MNDRIIEIGKYLKEFDTYLPYPIKHATIYRSTGLEKHILKRLLRKITSTLPHCTPLQPRN